MKPNTVGCPFTAANPPPLSYPVPQATPYQNAGGLNKSPSQSRLSNLLPLIFLPSHPLPHPLLSRQNQAKRTPSPLFYLLSSTLIFLLFFPSFIPASFAPDSHLFIQSPPPPPPPVPSPPPPVPGLLPKPSAFRVLRQRAALSLLEVDRTV